jgi:hypothetical protein
VIIALAVAAAALASFPLIERLRREPMFDLSLLRKPTFGGGLAALVPIRWLIGLGLGLVGLGLLLMRGVNADTGWTHLILGFAIAGAGSGLVNPSLASTAVRVVQPQDAGLASGINSTFRQPGTAISVAVPGSIFASKVSGATAATLTGHYASALNAVLLIAACVGTSAAARWGAGNTGRRTEAVGAAAAWKSFGRIRMRAAAPAAKARCCVKPDSCAPGARGHRSATPSTTTPCARSATSLPR